MTSFPHRLLTGGALAAGAATLGFAAGGVAGVDDDLAAAARPAPQVHDHLVEYLPERDCPAPPPPLGQEL